jgi:hypothetical protein
VLGVLKTILSGTYHALKYHKYGQTYLGAFANRFNCRFDLRKLVARLIVDDARTPKMLEAVIREGHPEADF